MLLLLTAGMTVACSSDNEIEAPVNPGEVQTPITITANYGDPTTRVSYSESGNTISGTWDEADQLLVVFDNKVNTLTLNSGAGTNTATFSGTITGTPSATSSLTCFVKDAKNPSAVTVSGDGSYTYADGTFLGQDGTLAGAAKCNLYLGTAMYGNGTNINCNFTVNTSMMKFYVNAPDGVNGGAATLTYKSGNTEMAKAAFTVGSNGFNTIYLTIPAGSYTGEQKVVFKSGSTEKSLTLSETKATFVAGQTYSKNVISRTGCDIARFKDYQSFDRDVTLHGEVYTIQDGGVVTGTLSWGGFINVASGATVTLHNVNLTNTSISAIRCDGDATIILSGDNNVTCSGYYNAIEIPEGRTLTIKGSGTLTATGGVKGVFGGGDNAGGTVNIENPSKVTEVTHN